MVIVVVRQSDAHAWAEVWLAGRGWTRVDPTAAVSPARVEGRHRRRDAGRRTAAGADPVAQRLAAHPAVPLGGGRTMRGTSTSSVTTRSASANCSPASACPMPTGANWPRRWRSSAASSLLAITAWTLYQRPRLDPRRPALAKSLAPAGAKQGRLPHPGKPRWPSLRRVEHERPAFGAGVQRRLSSPTCGHATAEFPTT